MNYFEIFGIPVQLKVPLEGLDQRFFELSRKYHPDYFANASPSEQVIALERSALLNKAWKTFQSPDETIKYVLKLKGLLEEEEKYELPAEFLMEVLEINEALMDTAPGVAPGPTDSPGETGLHKKVSSLEKEIYEPVEKIIEHYKEDVTTEEELLQVKAYYYKKKYLERIKNQLKGMH